MIIGVPKEIKPGEARVGLVPAGVSAYIAHGHSVIVERGAGVGSGIPDDAYAQAGARLVSDAADVWNQAELVVKVKEPLQEEYDFLRDGLVIYTYLHLASNEALTRALMASGTTAVGYETIQTADGQLPLLIPMSEVAGRLSVQKGAFCLEAHAGGRGILLCGASGVRPANVVILGAGVAGQNACYMAVGMGARVTLMDINPARLRYVHDVMGGRVTTLMSHRAAVEEEVADADLVIGSVLIAGARAPVVVPESVVRAMRPGSAIVDLSIDQGGCIATSRATTHAEPTYLKHGVVHYCVSNVPGAVPRTSTYALTNVTISYGLAIADNGVEQAARQDSALRLGLNVHQGKVLHPGVAAAFGLPCGEVAGG
ncbi:MAG: alanine dehydrogenase [Candidatus Hydrogenedentota bacterium]